MTNDIFEGQVVFQSKNLEDLKSMEDIFQIYLSKNIKHKKGYYELVLDELSEDEVSKYNGPLDIDEELTLTQKMHLKPTMDVFTLRYRMHNMNQSDFKHKDYVFYEYNFHPFIYQSIHGKQRPIDLKQALLHLIDDIREQDELKALSHEIKTSALYHEMVRTLMKDVYKNHYYDVTAFENSSELEKILIILEIINHNFKTYESLTYKELKHIFIHQQMEELDENSE